jgi:hypothetical protein
VLAALEAERFVEPERVVVGVGGDHEARRAVVPRAVARRLDDEPRADPPPPPRSPRLDVLVAAALAGHDQTAARRDLAATRVQRHVPGAATEREEGAQLRLAAAAVVAVGRLAEVLVAARNLKLHHLLPQVLIDAGGGVESAHRDLAVLAGMGADVLASRDKADRLLEPVAAREEVLAGVAQLTVERVPGQGDVAHRRLVRELAREEALPAIGVAGERRRVEQQVVAPPMGRVAGRAHHEIAVATLEHTVKRQHVDVRRPDERARHVSVRAGSSHGRIVGFARDPADSRRPASRVPSAPTWRSGLGPGGPRRSA